MKTEYGITVPRGVQKDWEANSMGVDGAGEYLRSHHAPSDWGNPAKCVAWFDRFGRCRLCVGHYANGRAVTMRKDANGKYGTTFHFAPAQVGRNPEGQDRAGGLGAEHEHAVVAISDDAPNPSRESQQ